MTLTAKDVAEITRLLEESSFDELSLELDGLKLTLRRNGVAAAAAPALSGAPAAPAVSGAPAAPGAPGAPGAPEAGAPATPVSQPDSSRAAPSAGATLDVTAPLLGTFYRAPKPGAPPFVEVGSIVEEGTIIGIIEVMKLMNTVRAGTRGRVVDVVAKDGALVEYGETLMRVSKAAQA